MVPFSSWNTKESAMMVFTSSCMKPSLVVWVNTQATANHYTLDHPASLPDKSHDVAFLSLAGRSAKP